MKQILPFTEFKRLAKHGNVIPVVLELPADLETPVSVFLKLSRHERQAFLLESVELGEKLGRFSLIGMNPDMTLEYTGNVGTFIKNGRRTKVTSDFLAV